MKAFFPPRPEGLTASFSRCIGKPECPSETLIQQLRQRNPPPRTLHLSTIDKHLTATYRPHLLYPHALFISLTYVSNDFFPANMNILCHNFNRKKNVEHRRNIME